MKTFGSITTIIVFCLIAAMPVQADVVSDWVEAAYAMGEAARGTADGSEPTRFVHAQVALAMFEAINAIDRQYESYLGFPKAMMPASQEAAAAVAAHSVLRPS